MKRILTLSVFMLAIAFMQAQDTPFPRRANTKTTTTTTTNYISSVTWKRSSETDYTLYDQNNNVLNGIVELGYLRSETLAVMHNQSRTIILLTDFGTTSNGSTRSGSILARNMSKDFYLTNTEAFLTFVNDETYTSNVANIDNSYVAYIPDLDRTYLEKGIRNFSNWGAKNLISLDDAPDNTYWYRDREKNEFGVIIKGETIDYDNANSRWDDQDLIVEYYGSDKYILENYKSASSFVFKPVKLYSGSSNNITNNNDDINCTGDCEDGWGKYIYDNGYYSGFWKNGFKEGYGLYAWDESGGSYLGTWDADSMIGYGVYIAGNDDNIIGEFRNGELNGLGLTVTGEDWVYGYFVDGVVQTEYDFYTNDVSSGCTAGDCENGYGRYKWSNGDAFSGFFKNGNLYMGSYSFNGGGRYTGKFDSDGNFDGIGRYFFEDGAYYGGQWKNGTYNGRGYYHDSEKVSQIGEWRDGTLINSYK